MAQLDLTTPAYRAAPIAGGDHDWQEVGRCAACRAPIIQMRAGADTARQTVHEAFCQWKEGGNV